MGHYWGRYVPVAERRAKAKRKINKLRKQGEKILPIEIEGRKIARSFWGIGWCEHLESFSDYENRLPRGRSYVRNGSVCHLDIQSGRIEAMVSGSSIYNVSITINQLSAAKWKAIKKKSVGKVGSILELLQGKLSAQVMEIVSDRNKGLFPKPKEMSLHCSCPDWATMCKHVAAVMYGVGHRLDTQPELLFLLRGVDAQELIETEIVLPNVETTNSVFGNDELSDIFGIDLDMDFETEDTPTQEATIEKKAVKRPTKKKTVKRPAKKKAVKRPTKKKAVKRPAKKKITKKKLAVTEKNYMELEPSGASISKLRAEMSLSIPKFADMMGVSNSSVRKWEATNGKVQLQADTLRALAVMHIMNGDV